MVRYARRRFTGMKRMASVERVSRSSGSFRRRGKPGASSRMYVMCVNNENNPESLELRKIYRAMPDVEGGKHGYIRVIDEEGEGYLYPKKHFIEVALPKSLPRIARNAFGAHRRSPRLIKYSVSMPAGAGR